MSAATSRNESMGVFMRLLLAVLRYPPPPADPYGSAGSIREIAASPRYLAYSMFKIWSRLLIVFAIEEFWLHQAIKGHVSIWVKLAVFVVLVGIPGFIISFTSFASYKTRSYKLSDRALRIREGVFVVRETTMTFANIQNVSVSRGPIQGLFGISDVVLKTAGGGGDTHQKKSFRPNLHTAHFHGLRNADEVRDLVLQLLRKTKDSGLGDADDLVAPASAQPSQVVKSKSDLNDVLSVLRAEATAFREAAERLSTRAL